MRLKIFVAGPIRGKGNSDLAANLKQAKEAGIALMHAGLSPLVPHLGCHYRSDTPESQPYGIGAEVWLDCNFAWIEHADALLRLPGESEGSDAEVAFAQRSGIPVFHSMAEVMAWKAQKDAEAAKQAAA